MRWPARLPYMPLEFISILHLLTCISTRTGRCCFTLFYSCFTPALSITELSFCFIYTRALLLLYFYFVTAVTCLLKCMQVYTRALLLLDSIFVCALQSKTRKRHLALVLKGLHALKHLMVELKHIITPCAFTPASPLLIHVTAVILLYLPTCSYNPAMACCSRGQLVKHCYTNRLMSVH
jgi:hypothetical protein